MPFTITFNESLKQITLKYNEYTYTFTPQSDYWTFDDYFWGWTFSIYTIVDNYGTSYLLMDLETSAMKETVKAIEITRTKLDIVHFQEVEIIKPKWDDPDDDDRESLTLEGFESINQKVESRTFKSIEVPMDVLDEWFCGDHDIEVNRKAGEQGLISKEIDEVSLDFIPEELNRMRSPVSMIFHIIFIVSFVVSLLFVVTSYPEEMDPNMHKQTVFYIVMPFLYFFMCWGNMLSLNSKGFKQKDLIFETSCKWQNIKSCEEIAAYAGSVALKLTTHDNKVIKIKGSYDKHQEVFIQIVQYFNNKTNNR